MRRCPPYQIAVCGYGIAGAAVASLLAEQGHEVTVFEQAPRCGPVGAGILLQPAGQVALREIGVHDAVAAESAEIRGICAITARGKPLVRLSYSQLDGQICAWGVRRGVLFRELHHKCQSASVTLREDHTIIATEQQGNRIKVCDQRGNGFGPFDFLIAADGARSRLRSATNISVREHIYAHAALWFVGRNEEITDELFQVVDGTHTLIGLLPMGRDQVSLFWGLHQTEWPQIQQQGLATWKNRVLRRCPQAAATLDEIHSLQQLTFTTFRHVRMQRWFDQHTVFLGDAAHAMSPHLGQGANLALLDAVSFAHAVASTDGFQAASRAYQQHRREVVQFYWWLTRLLTPFFQSSGHIRGWGRDLVLPRMPRWPWLRRQMLMTMAGLKSGWLASGELERPDPIDA